MKAVAKALPHMMALRLVVAERVEALLKVTCLMMLEMVMDSVDQ